MSSSTGWQSHGGQSKGSPYSHPKRVTGNLRRTFTFRALVRIVNERPLVPISDDPRDFTVSSLPHC